MKKLSFFIPLVVLTLLVSLFAIPLLKGKDPSILPSAMVGKPSPAFVLPSALEGRGFSSDDLRGAGPSVVNVFASWCVTCKTEQRVLAAMAKKTGVPVYGIVYKDKKEAVRQWLEENGNPFKAVGFDEFGRVSVDWGVYGVPETFIVDKNGVIRYKHVGTLTQEASEAIVQPLLRSLAG